MATDSRRDMGVLDAAEDGVEFRSDSSCTSQHNGWLSPRISFSTDFIGLQPERDLSDSRKWDDTSSLDFEFSMSSSSTIDPLSQGFMVTADELFHKGKLLPGYIPPPGPKEVTAVEPPQLDRPVTMARHLSAESFSHTPPSGCYNLLNSQSLANSNPRGPKTPKWRELFGALRRVKSDSGRQRVVEEPFLPPTKAAPSGKKFFRHFFRGGSGHHDTKSSGYFAFASTASSSASSTSASSSRVLPRHSPSTSSPSVSSVAAALSTREKSNSFYFPPVPSTASNENSKPSSVSKPPAADAILSAAVSGTAPLLVSRDTEEEKSEVLVAPSSNVTATVPLKYDGRAILLRKTSGKSVDGFGTLKNRVWGSPGRSPGRSSPARVSLRKMEKTPVVVNLVRSGSGRLGRNLERAANGGKSSIHQSLQEQTRALRSREIRRSPDRNGYSSSVRVTPVLNVPVCMGPVLRGANKSSKGRLSNIRNMFYLKREKLLTSFAHPIATQ